jgi:hypothetical protein
MITIIGIVVIVVGLICWIGQSLSFFAPRIAIKLGLCEPAEEMDPTLYIIETKAHGLTDMLLTWTLPLSGLLLIIDHKSWPVFALVGGGTYIYFSGLIILHRIFLKRRGIKIGRPSSEKGAYVFGSIWIIAATIMIVLAAMELGY